MTFLIFYIPICIVILAVLEVIKNDNPKDIAKNCLKEFLNLTAILIGCILIIYLLNKYL